MVDTILIPIRSVLEVVERIHFYEDGGRCPEDITFPSVMRTVMEYLGENLGCKHHRPLEKSWGLGCSYSYFMGVSGLAFAACWEPGWGDGTFALMEHLPGRRPEMFRRAFKAIGFGSQYIPADTGEAALREAIKASIYLQRRPVISFGIVGPPEATIITGYDEDGDVLLGWSFFQNMPEFNQGLEFEPGGYFRKRGWFPETPGVLLIGDKGPAPAQDGIFIDALKWGIEIARTPRSGGVATGLAAYDAWAAALRRDEDFPAGDEAVLRKRHELHEGTVGNIAEVRWYGSQWLLNTFEKLPEGSTMRTAEQLLKAAGCFAGEHEMMWRIWDLAGGIGNPDAWKKLAEPQVRAQMVPIIQASRDRYAQAIELIEEALRKA
jgi:hypothetical protein